MTYRSADAVLQERLAEVERDLAELEERGRALVVECETIGTETKTLEARLAVSGPGGGAARGPTFDRISVLVTGLCVVGALVVPAEIYIGGWVRRTPGETVVPLLLLAGPGALAAMIAWPYRRVAGYTAGAVIGALLALAAVLNLVVGFWR